MAVGSPEERAGDSLDPSSPMATTRPPEDSGSLGMFGDAEDGRGFRLTGECRLTLDVYAWKAAKDGTSVDGVTGCFQRVALGKGVGLACAEAAGAESGRSSVYESPRFMVF